MTDKEVESELANWWRTNLTAIKPNQILIRGYPIEELIGGLSFPAITLLMLTGELAPISHVSLLEAAMVSSVDHGPQAPSVATARIAASCGLPFNGILASSVGMLGDVHGGAGQQSLEMLNRVVEACRAGLPLESAVRSEIDPRVGRREHLPGFGHRYHTEDPRSTRLQALVSNAADVGDVSGEFLEAARAIGGRLNELKGRTIGMNVDGATAIVYGELNLAPELARALFIVSRAIGLTANAWEERQFGSRLKGPMPRSIIPAYGGPPLRHLAESNEPGAL